MSGMPAVARVKVVSFEGLADEVVAAVGGGKTPVVSKTGRLLAVGAAMREVTGPRIEGVSAGEVLEVFDELSRGGAMGRLASVASSVPGELGGKLAWLARVREVYEKVVGGGRFDKDSRMEFVLSRVGMCGGFAGARFFVDGFVELLDFERRFVVGLAGAGRVREVNVTFCMDPASPMLEGRGIHQLPDEGSVLHPVERSHRALRIGLETAGVAVGVERLAGTEARFGKGVMGRLEAAMGGFAAHPPSPPPPPPPPPPPATATATAGTSARPAAVAARAGWVRVIEAADRSGEVRAAAREIRRWVSGGGRYREVVVLARDVGEYERDVVRVFGEYGIPMFLDQRRGAWRHALPRLVRAVVGMARDGWSGEEVAAACRGGLFGEATAELAGALWNFGVLRGVEGEAWTRALVGAEPEVEGAREKVVGALRPMVEALRRPEGVGARDLTVRLLEMFEKVGVRSVLARWMREAEAAGEHEQSDLHPGVWGRVMAVLEEMAELLGEREITLEVMEQVVLPAIASIDVGLTPPTLDQVIVGSVDRTRMGDAKVAVVLGLSQGIFPRRVGEAGLISAVERAELRAAGVELCVDNERRQLDERLLGYLAMTRASEGLVLIRPKTDGRAELGESVFWAQAVAACGSVERAEGEDGAMTVRELAGGLLKWAGGGAKGNEPVYAGVYGKWARGELEGTKLGEVLGRAWGSLDEYGEIGAEGLRAWRGEMAGAVRLSVGEVEAYAQCPFKWWMKHGLEVGGVSGPVVDGRAVLGVMRRVLGERDWTTRPAEELNIASAEARGTWASRLTTEGTRDTTALGPGGAHELERLDGQLALAVDYQRAARSRTRFGPGRRRVEFGGERGGAAGVKVPITVRGKRVGEAEIGGFIDRVDVTRDGKLAIAWNYKLVAKRPAFGFMYHGLELGLLVQLLALEELAGGARPVGAFALPVTRRTRGVSKLAELESAPEIGTEDFALQGRKARGLFDAEAHDALEPGGVGEVFGFKLKKDGTLDARGDGLTPEQFGALLRRGRELLEVLLGGMAGGDVGVRPFYLGNQSACVGCEFGHACRFDPRGGVGKYEVKEAVSAAELAAQSAGGEDE
jgi:ATP-dependent helicase/nuclease subunit B